MWTVIFQWLSAGGGVVVVVGFLRWLYTASLEKRGKAGRLRADQNATDADTLLKLLTATPGEVLRLQERLRLTEGRVDELERKLTARTEEADSLRAMLSQLNIQLADAQLALAAIRKGYADGPGQQ